MATLVVVVAAALLLVGGVESAGRTAAANDNSIVGEACSRTSDKKACVEFLLAFPEAKKATTVAPLAELYLHAIANITAEGKAMASKELAAQKGKGVPPVCLDQCAASIDTLSEALSSFFSASGAGDRKYEDLDRFLVGFIRTTKQPPACQSVCPLVYNGSGEIAVVEKFHQAWKLLAVADGLVH
uniref:Pectinesterase inhibitor domain-containing protein n=1 Tax=Leersia perrieri TaxID=77586 RepID=A0A0D9V8Z2_9ORYZ